jgi:enoyl-CoA hydratase/carnithine racemase
MRRETVVVDLALRTLDFKEGVRAFLERREPRFEGR